MNYNCVQIIEDMIGSIGLQDRSNIEVNVVDNSGEVGESFCEKSRLDFAAFKVLHPGQNLGYLNGAQFAIETHGQEIAEYESVMIVNPDILFSREFWGQLASLLRQVEGIGVVFPSVFDTNEKREMNPFLSERPDKSFLDLRIRAFSNRINFSIWNLVSKLKRRLKSKALNTSAQQGKSQTIYAGYGALMIFTPAYFKFGGTFSRPTFLYAEELYIAETCRALNLTSLYDPTLETKHLSHATTSLIPSNSRRLWSLESLLHIREKFY